MSNITQETTFLNSGLNQDDSELLIDLGSSPYRLNIMVSGNNATGVLTNLIGNSLAIDISDHKLTLSNTYVTIGSFYNRLTRKCYYFVFTQPYDSGGGVYIYDNKLFCFNEDQKTLDLIFTDTKNHFQLNIDYPMRDCTMLDDWLYFNPRVSEPKMVDVTRAYNYTNYTKYDATATYIYGGKVTFNGGLFLANKAVAVGETPSTHVSKWDRIGDSYRDKTELGFDSEFDYAFNVIKMPPVGRPLVTYGDDTHIQINNVRGKVFRFSYRYKYFDDSYSVYSSFSNVTLPEGDEAYNGEIVNKNTTKNYINVAVAPHSPALIKELEVVFRESAGDWKRVKIINRQEQAILDTFSTFSFDFYNNESYVVVDNVSVERIQDYVPKQANSQEIINKNILAYGGCLEGFDNIPKEDIDVTLTPVLQNISFTPTIGTIRHPVLYRSHIQKTDINGNDIDGMGIDLSWLMDTVVETDIFYITLDGLTEYYTITHADALSVSTLRYNLIIFLKSKYPAYDINNNIVSTRIDIWTRYGDYHLVSITTAVFCSNGGNATSLSKKQGFKTGANHPFCIYYYDENIRRWDAQVSKDNTLIFGLEMQGTTVYVPMFNEVSPIPANSTSYRWTIDWEVNHLPPTGAKYWRWGYAGNSLCDKMVQYVISDVTDSIAAEGINMCKIDITPLQTLKTTTTATWNQFPSSIIDAYVFQKGDRIRFITKEITVGAGSNLEDLVDGVFEYEILKQDDATDTIYIQGTLASNGLTTAGIGASSLVEIYSPLKSITDTKTVYNEFGDLMYILPDSDGVMTHQGQAELHNQDTLLGHTAMGTFDGGDVYHITRTPSKPLNSGTLTLGAFHESMWYSDFYDSDDYDKGKIGFETSFGERFLNIVRYSRPFFQNTMVNGLPTFEEAPGENPPWPGFKELSDVFGDIVAIYEQGDTLKVYQERKASSILIGRTEYMDSTGAISVAISTSVLGAVRTSPSNYSTVFPESIARNNKYIYGFDIYNGVVWRDSVNGLFPISGRYAEAGGDADYKMQTYFKLKAKALMESGIDHVDVLTVWDEEYKNLYITFKDYVVDSNCETIMFHEPSNRWISFVEFSQTPFGGYNVPLRLTYEIVKGFKGGIGFSFDEESGFDVFDIKTSTDQNLSPITSDMQFRMSLPMPSISCSADVTPVNIPMVMTMGTPVVSVYFLTLSVNSVTWPMGGNDVRTLTVTVTGGTQWSIVTIPEWLDITRTIGGGLLSVSSVINSGELLYIYPNQPIYLDKVDDKLYIKDFHENYSLIYASYNAGTVVTVYMAINPLDDSNTILVDDWVCYGTVASTELVTTFTVNHTSIPIGQDQVITYSIIRNGVEDSDGHVTIRNGIRNDNMIFNLISGAEGGDSIYIYLAASNVPAPIEVINVNVTPVNIPMVMTMGTPTITIHEATVTSTSLNWASTQYGYSQASAQTFTITDGSIASLIYKPNWLSITVVGGILNANQAYTNETLYFFPSNPNYSLVLTDTVVFQTPEGVIINIAVEHAATTSAYLQVQVLINPTKPNGADGITPLELSGAASIATGDNEISLHYMLDDYSRDYLTRFSIQYDIYKNGVYWMYYIDYDVYNMEQRTVTITTPNNAVAGDNIIVYLCRY